MKTIRSLALSFILVGTLSVTAAGNMKAFPPAEAGTARHVLQLPQHPNESALKVELIVGKTVLLDTANRYFFAGKMEAENIHGWGFTRYIVRELGPMAGTKIGPDPNAPKKLRFIAIAGEPYLIRYNSRLPVVIYVPKGVEVRYRIWSTSTEMETIEEG